MRIQLRRLLDLTLSYKYHLASVILFFVGVKLISISGSAKIPECSNISILEKLKYVTSANLAGEKFSGNKVTSVFDISEIDEPSNTARSCRAGLTIEGSELGNVNYMISISAPGNKELINIDTTLD